MSLVVTEEDVHVSEDIELINRLRGLFGRARSRRRPRIGLWNRNRRLVYNRQPWGRTQGRYASASEIYPILHALIGWMTDQRQVLDINPSCDPGSPYADQMGQVANDLKTVLDSLWLVKDFDLPLEQVLWDAMMFGTGIFKVVWDPAEDHGMGNAILTRVDPWAFYPDPNAPSLEEAEYMFEARLISWDELDRRFPGASAYLGKGAEERLDTPDDLYGGSKEPMGNPGNLGSAGTGGNASTSWGGPGATDRDHANREGGVTIYECWLRENEMWEDDEGESYTQTVWRLIVFSGNYILLDERCEDLWDHGGHPYVRYVLQDLGEFWGMSLVEHLAQPQEALNRILASIQGNAELIGDPVWLEDTRAQIGRAKITNRPGQRLYKTAGSDAGWQTPPALPAFMFQMVQFWIGEMERISGLSAIVRGATPTHRNAQGVLDQVQEAAFVRVRAALRNMERSLRGIGTLLSSLVVENYTTPRIVAVAGPQAQQSALALRGKHFYQPGPDGATPLKYELWVEAGGKQPTSRQARAQEIDFALSVGAADRRAWLEFHNIPNWQQIDQRMTQREQLGMQQHQKATAPGARQRAGRKE